MIDPRRTRTAERGRRAPLHPAGHRRASPVRDRAHALRRGGPGALGRLAEHTATASTRSSGWRAPFTPEAVAAACGIAAPEHPPHRARARRRRTRRRLRPDRHLHAGVRHARELARRRAQRAHRQPRPRRAARCSPRPPPASRTRRGTPGSGKRRALRPLDAAACAACPRCYGELPVACLAEEIETPGEGQIRALITVAGNPVAEHAERRAPAPRARRARLHGERRHLPERDDAPRRRDPAGAVGARSARTTTSRSTSSRSATSPTTRRRAARAADRQLARVADAAAAGRHRQPARGPTPTSTRSTTS